MTRVVRSILMLSLLLMGPGRGCVWAQDCQDDQLARLTMPVVAPSQAASVVDSCTGTLTFSWHCENADVTLGTPPGCSAGDTTGTVSSGAVISNTQAWDGTNSMSFPTVSDYYTFDAANIISTSAGTIVIHAYITAWVAASSFFYAVIDGDNYLQMQLSGTDEMLVKWEGNNALQSVTTTDANMVVNTWYTITVKYTTADVNPNLWIQVCDTNGANCSTAISNNNNLTPWVGVLSTFSLGDRGAGTLLGFIDGVKIYNSTTP